MPVPAISRCALLMRLVAGFTFAPLMGAIVYSFMARGFKFDLSFIILAYVQVAAFGGIYWVFRRVRITITHCILAGVTLAFLPWLMPMIVLFDPPAMSYKNILGEVMRFLLAGGLAGFLFWVCFAWRNPHLASRMTD
jgi:fucose 4-O-acetylase-like acetyltransferase